MSVELPGRLGPYLLLRHLASGGMGEVYLAHQEHHGAPRLCVVKTVRAEYAHDRVATRRFVDEARTSALLAHRNIVAVYDVGEDGGRPYIAVEYVPGRDLMAIFVAANDAGAPVPEAIGLAIAAELLDALDEVHRAVDPRSGAPLHVVHRDVSPQNVLVAFDGAVKLIDFGIARCAVRTELTHVGQLVGKLRYISPEQARGEPVGPPTDVWAACVTVCELLTGRRFWGDRRAEAVAPLLAVGARVEPPGFAALAPDVRAALEVGLDPDATQRPSASWLRDQLSAAVVERGHPDPQPEIAALLERLFAGERLREEQARVTLLHEPSVVHAAQFPEQTAYRGEPSEPARTIDERASTGGATVGMRPRALPGTQALDATPLVGVEQTPFTPAAPRPRPRRRGARWVLPAALGAAVGVTAALWLAPSPAARTPVVPHLDLVGPAAPTTATPPGPSSPAPPTPAGAATSPPAPLVEAAPAPPPVHVDPPPSTERAPIAVTRPATKATKAKKAEPKPRLFGDRVRALRECAPRPSCAAAVLGRTNDVLTLSVDELRALDGELERCLRRCEG
ncbi:MAG: serine/threonine protein kinase [Deltaproteobacteria bacterium]|nr:serine/threonine protein kinase [Deltaproteobacteria bacterium]